MALERRVRYQTTGRRSVRLRHALKAVVSHTLAPILDDGGVNPSNFQFVAGLDKTGTERRMEL